MDITLRNAADVAQFIAANRGSGARRVSGTEAAKYGTRFEDSSLPSLIAARRRVDVAADAARPDTLHPDYIAALPWTDQWAIGECTAEMAGEATQFAAFITHGYTRPLSGMFNYNYSYDGSGVRQFDNGATIGGALETAQNIGICRDEVWPDSIKDNWNKHPSPEADEDAKNQKPIEVVYIGEGHDPGMAERVDMIIDANVAVCGGIGDHAFCWIQRLDWGWNGRNCKGPPNQNTNGMLGVFRDLLSTCWNLYALPAGVNYTGHDLQDPEKFVPIFHQMYQRQMFSLGTLIAALGDNPMSAAVDAIRQAYNQLQQMNSILGSAIAGLPTQDPPPSGPPATTTALVVTPNPATYLAPVTLRATVTGANPTGSVNFTDGQVALGSPPLVAGVATLSINTLPVGLHSIKATYSGNATNAGSSSAAVPLVINAAGGGGGNIEVMLGGAPFTDPSGGVWRLIPADPRYGGTVERNERRNNSAHKLIWDATAQKMKLKQGDTAQPNTVYTWVEWVTGDTYLPTTPPVGQS